MEQIVLTWEAITNDGKRLIETKSSYGSVDENLGNLSFFNLYFEGEKLFSLDFKKGLLYRGTSIIKSFDKIDQKRFKFRRRHVVRYSMADKIRKPDFLSYVFFINDEEIEVKPPYKLSDKKSISDIKFSIEKKYLKVL